MSKKAITTHHKYLWLLFLFIGLALLVVTFILRTQNLGDVGQDDIRFALISPVNAAQGSLIQNGTYPSIKLAVSSPGHIALVGSGGAKRIEIDLTNQRLYAYEGDKQIFNFLVSTGKWGRTPTGTFRIWTKLRLTRMTGGSKDLGTFYDLPNVPYVMFFDNQYISKAQGYSIHGTYWHNNFGHPMSHGCINMRPDEAKLLYFWANPNLEGKDSIYATNNNPGTEVVIFGEAPQE